MVGNKGGSSAAAGEWMGGTRPAPGAVEAGTAAGGWPPGTRDGACPKHLSPTAAPRVGWGGSLDGRVAGTAAVAPRTG